VDNESACRYENDIGGFLSRLWRTHKNGNVVFRRAIRKYNLDLEGTYEVSNSGKDKFLNDLETKIKRELENRAQRKENELRMQKEIKMEQEMLKQGEETLRKNLKLEPERHDVVSDQ